MKTEIKYAVLFVIVSFVENCIEFAFGLQSRNIAIHPYIVTPFYLVLTAVVYYFSIREKRRLSNGSLTFLKAFTSGIVLTLLIIILNPVLFYVFTHFINPDFFRNFALHDVTSGKSSASESEAYYTFTNLLLRGSLYRLIMGVVVSLIISIFIKKNEARYWRAEALRH